MANEQMSWGNYDGSLIITSGTSTTDTFWQTSTSASTAPLEPTDMERTYNAVVNGIHVQGEGEMATVRGLQEREEALAPKDFNGGDLMELVNKCANAKAKGGKVSAEATNVSVKLKELGFTKAHAQIHGRVDLHERLERIAGFGYIKIEDSNIEKFLDAKVKTYDDACPKKKVKKTEDEGDITAGGFYVAVDSWAGSSTRGMVHFSEGGTDTLPSVKHYNTIIRDTCHRQSEKKGTIGLFAWKETDIKDYSGIPPVGVLETFGMHKARELFHDFSVAEVEGVHDPLLLGRLDGRPERYFIAQWGDDVQLDDLL